MTRYVIGPDVAIRLAHDQAVIRGGHQVLAQCQELKGCNGWVTGCAVG